MHTAIPIPYTSFVTPAAPAAIDGVQKSMQTTQAVRLKEVSFDLYERYILLDRIGEFFRPPERPYRVLDVGGHTPAFWPGFSSMAGVVIPDANVTVVDTFSRAELRNYVQASRLRLPFADDTFDLACSLDTLEHLPDEHRPALLSELLRVTRNGLYIAFPFESASNRWAESILAGCADVLLQDAIPALLEHRQFGLPRRDLVTGLLAGRPYPWVDFEHGNTDIWLLMMLTYYSLRRPGTDFVLELNRRFNQVYAAQDWGAPAYRTGYVLSKLRVAGDLETLRASFVSTENPADLQAVLAFCQLFLNIAQSTRVTVDKDRHIGNLETELKAAQARLEQARREFTQQALDSRELNGLVSEIAMQVEQMREQLRDLLSQSAQAHADHVESQARLDSRLRDLEVGQVTNKRAIQAIYDSRIWRAFSGVGGLLLRLTGQAVPARGQEVAGRAAPDRGVPRERPIGGDFLGLVCDHPGGHGTIPVRDVVEIRGWALARSGIDRVLVRVGNQPPEAAAYGILRPDVGRSYPEIAGSDHAGYRFFWDTSGLPEGPRSVRVRAIARSGQRQEVTCNVVIDRSSSPGYDLWIARNEPTAEQKRQMRWEIAKFPASPRIGIAVPVHKTPIGVLTRCIESVLEQIYPNWELCLVDDGSGDPAITGLLQQYVERDSRIRVLTLPQSQGISAATNQAVHQCSGEYVAFLDHDDELADFALWEVVRAIQAHSGTDVFYSDEDKIDEHGRRYDPFCKPRWSPDLLLSCNYICHFVVVKRSLLDLLGGLDEKYNGSQDYEFLLRATRHTQKIERIPKILYHWRALPGSAASAAADKPQAGDDGRRALAAHLANTAPGATVEEVKPCRYRVRYPIAGDPRVAILIPTNGHMNLFRAAVEEVLDKTSYPNYEILLIDNSRDSRLADYTARLASRNLPVRHFDWRNQPFNFSSMNNAAARAASSPYLLFLNDDTTIITPEWLTAMLEHGQRPEVGAVGAQLWYPDDLIQHAGVVMGLYGNCSHAFKNQSAKQPHYFDFPELIRNCSAVTAACMLVARHKFFEAGGFDETNLAVAFQDVDFCLKLLELGYRNVYTPYAKLYHYESATKNENEKIPHPAEDNYMKKKWAKYIADDPYYNPNLARRREDFSLAVE